MDYIYVPKGSLCLGCPGYDGFILDNGDEAGNCSLAGCFGEIGTAPIALIDGMKSGPCYEDTKHGGARISVQRNYEIYPEDK
jgi:hypothetical protein